MMSATWMLECTLLKTIFFEKALVLLGNIERLDSPFVLELQTSLSSTILNVTQYLHLQLGVLDKASIPTNILVLNLSTAHIAPVLNFDKLMIDDEPTNFNNIADNFVGWDAFDKCNPIIGGKVIDLITNLTDNSKLIW